ncbi:MAG: hypothetical protein JSS63_02400 [Bacteroidetes bacterium]|nr:hypothetical protein [Bacteroidota bacterium]
MTQIPIDLALASGNYRFIFHYNKIIAGTLTDFVIYELSNLSQGFEDENNDDLAIYPANIDITIDDETRTNFLRFKNLKDGYSDSYPFNFENVFYLEIYKDINVLWFKGILDTVEQGVEDYRVTLKFVDGINKLKDVSLGNPFVLDFLYQKGLINRIDNGTMQNGSYFAYGYKTEEHNLAAHIFCGTGINIEGADKDVYLKSVIENLFKLLNTQIILHFQNEFRFQEVENNYLEAEISEVMIKRVCSNLFGRYIVLKKSDYSSLVKSSHDLDYTEPSNYQVVYEDSTWITYYHNWEGTLFPKVFHKGMNERKLSDFLKYLCRNLFSYYGFETPNKVFWRHKRFTNPSTSLNRILKLDADTSINKINSIRVKGINNKNEYLQGNSYENSTYDNLSFEIPFTVEDTTWGHESWLYFKRNSSDHQVVNIVDLQTNFTPAKVQEIIAKDEYELRKESRLKIETEVEGVDYTFNDTYKTVHENVQYVFRPIMMEKDLVNNTTKITGIEIS